MGVHPQQKKPLSFAMGSREHLMFLLREAGLEIAAQQSMAFGLVVGLVAIVRRTSVGA